MKPSIILLAVLSLTVFPQCRATAQTAPPGQLSRQHMRVPQVITRPADAKAQPSNMKGQQTDSTVQSALPSDENVQPDQSINRTSPPAQSSNGNAPPDQSANGSSITSSPKAKPSKRITSSPKAKPSKRITSSPKAKPSKRPFWLTCDETASGEFDPKNPTYNYRLLFPLYAGACAKDATDPNQAEGQPFLSFYQVAGKTTFGNQVQYLYNAKQSTNAVNADLYAGTFPGFQAVLSATTTDGSAQPATPSTGSSTGSTSTPTSTDSPSTAIAKLEQGGDFNVRFTTPLLYNWKSNSTALVSFVPNVGFNVSGLSGQNTITQSTEYAFNIPVEAYFELSSYDSKNGMSNAALYFDYKGGEEVISQALKTAIGVPSRNFLLQQFSVGVQFANSIRVGFQYFSGPSQIYSGATSTSAGIAAGTTSGLHLVVSFNPAASNGNAAPAAK